MSTINRCRRARETAGLSLGQASRLIGVPIDQLQHVEENDAAYADADPLRLADIYGVNVDWLSGRCEQRDWAAVKELDSGGKLTFRERDMLAELYASLPRRSPST